MQKKDWLILSALLIILFALETFVVQRYLTSQVPGANDFYSRWHGARAFLLEGRNPYALDVTEEIQPIIGIDPSEVGRGGFNYPLHAIFFFWPLAYLTYDWAQALWWTVVLWLAIASTIVLLQWLEVKSKPSQLLTFLLVALTFYPITRSVFLGQFTLHILFFLALALLLLKTNQPVLSAVELPTASSATAGATHKSDFWAGVALSAASIKPQMLILVVPFLLLWAIAQKRWRFVYGLLAGGVILLAASLALMPSWPLEFLADTRRYRQFSGGFTPLQLLVDTLAPNAPALLWQIPAALLVLIMLYFWWKSRGSEMKPALYWTIVVQTLVTFQTGTTNQVLLWILILDWLASTRTSRGARLSLAFTALVWFAAWTLFIRTLGEHEHPIMFLPLSLLTLILLAIQSVREMGIASGRTPSQ